nr:hypothetical protein GCM10025730_12150 [Promicromonospora thailandica]
MSKGPRSAAARRDWGSDESGCSVLHLDMDAFFASCELARRPELRGLPVIVGGQERGVVLAATYEARAFGVRSAMPMTRARLLCPQATVVRPDHTLYRDVSRSVMELLHEVTPLVEQISVDEAFLDVSGARRRLGPPTAIGAELRRRIEAEHGVTASVGIARNKFVAKLASTHAKPDGMMLVPAAATVDFLHTLPVGALWGWERRPRRPWRRGASPRSRSWRTRICRACRPPSGASPAPTCTTWRGAGTRAPWFPSSASTASARRPRSTSTRTTPWR